MCGPQRWWQGLPHTCRGPRAQWTGRVPKEKLTDGEIPCPLPPTHHSLTGRVPPCLLGRLQNCWTRSPYVCCPIPHPSVPRLPEFPLLEWQCCCGYPACPYSTVWGGNIILSSFTDLGVKKGGNRDSGTFSFYQTQLRLWHGSDRSLPNPTSALPSATNNQAPGLQWNPE